MPLEVILIRAILFIRLVTVCSIYISLKYPLTKAELHNLINQLPEPYIIIKDCNAHKILWGDLRCDARGRLVENILTTSDLCLLNKKEPTYYNLTEFILIY
uniref:Putative tick transposon n=1 Tax=Rhipicephalus microplus TaxID=6941 RepID=A0A6G5A0V7_RHIMP